MKHAGKATQAALRLLYWSLFLVVVLLLFGMLARLDRSGRSMAATPAMLMTGAAIGPILGGTLVKASGYGALGIAAVLIAFLAVACFSRLPLAAASVQLVGKPA